MKGMRRISRGAGFRGALDYAFDRTDEKESGRLIGGNMSGEGARELSAEFAAVRALRPNVAKPTWHNSLRLPAGDKLDDEIWRQIADSYMQKMGFKDLHPRVYVMHDDAEGQHIHIVASRVALDGSLYLGQNENLKSTQYIAEIEKKFHLRITKGADHVNGKPIAPEKKALKKGEIEKAVATGERPARLVLQDLVSDATEGKPTTTEFIARLTVAGVVVVPNVASTGAMNGFAFEYAGVAFSGSKLGDKYKWSSLQKRIDYDQTRDSEELDRWRNAARSLAKDGYAAVSDEPTAGTDPAVGSGNRADHRSDDADSAFAEIDRSTPDEDRSDASDRQRQEAPAFGEQSKRARDTSDARSDIETIAGVIQETAQPAIERDLAEKIGAWRKQHAAIDAQSYQVSMRSAEGKDRVLDACDATGIEKMIPDLTRYEKRGQEIQVQAADPKQHFIQLHNMNAGQLEALCSAGFTPALVMQSGQGMRQAIITIERKHADDEPAVRDVGRVLSTQFSVSATVNDRMQLAGFKQRGMQQTRVITRIIEAARVFCRRAQQMLFEAMQKLNDDAAKMTAAALQAARRKNILDPEMHPLAGQVRQYMQLARDFLTQSPRSAINDIDVQVAREMLTTGLAREEIERPIAVASPGAVAYGVIAHDYARDVLDTALAEGGGQNGALEAQKKIKSGLKLKIDIKI